MAENQDSPRPDAINRFLDFLKESELSCESNGPMNKKTFVCIDAVKAHLAARGAEKLKDILDALFEGKDTPDCGTILSSDASYVAVLCVLLKINKGRSIGGFIRRDLSDNFLRPHRESRPKELPDGISYEEFRAAQWMFNVPPFTKAMIRDFDKEIILPITKKTFRGRGGSAEIYEIQIHACCNKFHGDIQGNARKMCYQNLCKILTLLWNSHDEMLNTFVLKTYTTKDAQQDYDTENTAYRTLGEQDDTQNIVDFYGSFTHADTGSHNIIMERADKESLEKYFRDTDPPRRSKDIKKFWHNLFEILTALNTIQHVEQRVLGARKVLKGWHQDVKPANILVFSNNNTCPYEYTFKLADFGTSHFLTATECGSEVTALNSTGTLTYGAPECYNNRYWNNSGLRIKQKVDVWSFGCILSEAAVWLACGYKELQKYQEELSKASPNGSFHDGTKVLGTVREWHDKVRQAESKSDNFTSRILATIENDMLLENPSQRMDPICILSRAEYLLPRSSSANIAATLHNPLEARSQSDGTIRHREVPPPSPAVLQKILTGSVHSGQEIAPDIHPLTRQYLQEHYRTIQKCKAAIAPVEKILSILSDADKSLESRDHKAAHEHFDKACKIVVAAIKDTSKNRTQIPDKVLLEQHLYILTGLTKCELDIIRHAPQPLSKSQEGYLIKAKHYANKAFGVQKFIDPKSSTCEARDLIKEQEGRIH